jgi:hypothetical protein
VGNEWEIKCHKNDAGKAWDQLCNQHPEAAARVHNFLAENPRRRTDRNHPLRGELGVGVVRGVTVERWQHEVTGAGRVWFLIDDERHTIWLDVVALGHPKTTE